MCVVSMLTAAFLFAAAVNTAGAPDDRAHKWVAVAIERMGGEARLRDIHRVRFTATGYHNLLEQSERPEGPWVPSIEQSTQEWDLDGGQWNAVEDMRIGEFQFSQRQVVDREGVVASVANKSWSPGSRARIDEMRWRFAAAPFRAVLAAADAADLHVEPDRQFQGVAHHVVAWNAPDGLTRLLLNADTGYPTAVEMVRACPNDLYWQVWGDVTTRVLFSYWAIEPGGLRMPRQWDIERNGLLDSVLMLLTLEFNPTFGVDAFAIPDDTRTAFQGRAEITLDRPSFGSTTRPPKDLAPGIVQVPSSWDVTFVRQDDGVVIIEAPISAGYSSRVIEEARKRFPGVAVKAVVTTSDSWPHFGGIREYVARGIPIYFLDVNRPILERAMRSPHTLHPDALQQHQRPPVLHAVAARTILGTGKNRLELYPVRGETGERMMAIYMPEHRILYGSDLVQWSRGGPPEYVSELLDLATRERLTVETVYAMHADPGPWSRVVNAVR
jgi:hypothetical protein